MYIQTTGLPSALWFIDSYATNQTRSFSNVCLYLSLVPFREDFHQSEDGFSILILTNKIASGKSETGDGNTMPQVFGNRPDKKERTKHNGHVGKQKGANFTIISATLLHKQHVY